MRTLARLLTLFSFSALSLAAVAQDATPPAEAPAPAVEEPAEPALQWQAGPLKAPIGSALAEIDLPEGYAFLDREGTLELLRMTGNLTGDSELATVAKDGADWFVIFEWDDSGWVDDSDRGELDAAALLESLQEGNAAGNEQRKELGLPTLELLGWQEEPRYDEKTKNLTWATKFQASDAEGVSVNRLVKLLGRRGVMSATLVASPDELAGATVETDQLLAAYRFLPGSTYAEYLPGTDKAAGYGLGALVVGGVLAKTGFLAKFWKLIAAGAVAAFAGIKRLFTGKQADAPPA